MVDRNLFPYDLAVVAIFKDEARYLREWLNYHLLAGVEHFYLYNNDSSDDYAEVLKPYVDANIVTLTDWTGKIMQMPAYNDALERFKFFCRYMAFVDIDEFIYPKTNQSIVDVLDEILSRDERSAALAINWQIFGSNGHEAADFSRGVLERFTRRAEKNWVPAGENLKPEQSHGNEVVKSVVDPRKVDFVPNPHYAVYFHDSHAVNENGRLVEDFINAPITAEKIVVNHYYTKSREEMTAKMARGRSDVDVAYVSNLFEVCDRNEVFDDGILHYRAARAENFSLPDEAQRFRRVEKFLIDTLTAQSPFDAPAEFFGGKVETFLTCRRLAEHLGTRIGNRSAEEYALVWLYQTLNTNGVLNYADLQLFMSALPEILSRPFPLCRKILQLTRDRIIPTLCEALRFNFNYRTFTAFQYVRRLLDLME